MNEDTIYIRNLHAAILIGIHPEEKEIQQKTPQICLEFVKGFKEENDEFDDILEMPEQEENIRNFQEQNGSADISTPKDANDDILF